MCLLCRFKHCRILIVLASECEQNLDLHESGLIWEVNPLSLRSSPCGETLSEQFINTQTTRALLLLRCQSASRPDLGGDASAVFRQCLSGERKMFLIEKDNRVLLWRAMWGYRSPACVGTDTKTNNCEYQDQI